MADDPERRSSDLTAGRATDETSLSRRNLLKLSAGGVAAGLAGCTETGGGRADVKPTPAEPPAETPERVADFEMETPRLTTPWTAEVDPANPLPEYPRPQLTRKQWQSLNGVWEFQTVDGLSDPPTGTSLAEQILVPFPVESAISGVWRSATHMWYRRTFSVPSAWDERVILHFGAVDFEATVYVNGTEVGSHEGGYDGFSLDVTDALDGDGDQELVVAVYDPTDDGAQPLGKQRDDPEGIYYTSCSGIWQTVWLEPVPETHIEDLDLTPDLERDALRLTVNAPDSGATVKATAYADGEQVGSVSGSPNEELVLSIPDPHLWSPEDPFLYDLDVELRRDGETVDTVGSYFGMRSIGMETINGAPRLTLNGEFVFHMATLDQGYWPDGIYTAPTDEALRFDLEKHVELGFNAVRKHVKVEPNRWYYWADRLGLLVWQDMPSSAVRGEVPDQSAQEQFERELHRMIEEHGNHPSITTWVPFNEGWGSYDVERITESIREQDPARLVDSQSGINVCRGWTEADTDICGTGAASDFVDWHVYPGPDSPPPTEDRAAVLGEYGGVGLPISDHLWNPGKSYSYASASDGAALTDTYVSKLEQIREYMTGCGGLTAAVYTQLTDVEREINGLLTYDRRVLKPDGKRLRAAHRKLLQRSAQIETTDTRSNADTGLTGVGYWPFERGSGTVAEDKAGDHDAKLVDLFAEPPQWTDGRIGTAIEFDGTRDFLDAGAPVVETTGPFSAAAWVRIDRRGGDMVAVSQDTDTESAFTLGYVDSDRQFAFGVPGTRVIGGPTVEPGTWYHVAGTISGCAGIARLYVDGRQVASKPLTRAGVGSQGHTIIGRGKTDGLVAQFWDGTIDEVHVYNRAISQSTVAQLYEQG